jgi:magnesium-transporting ATPase (P-type)
MCCWLRPRITAALGHWVDTGVILGVVFINALVGFVQEGKAESALDAIRKMLSLRALVLRDGQRREIAAEELVPGDWVLLQSGDKVPADLRLVDAQEPAYPGSRVHRRVGGGRES